MPLKINANPTTTIEGTAPKGSTLEAIDLSYAAGNKQALDEYEEVAKVGQNGKFSLALGDLPGTVKAGDYVRFRAKTADGKSAGIVTIRIGGTDKTDAPFVVPRLVVYGAGSGKAIVSADDKKRPVSEPKADVEIVNTRTGDTTTVTLDKDGHFPKNFSVKAKAGDVLELSVSDGTNTSKTVKYTVVGKEPHANDIADPDAHHDQKDAQGRLKVGMRLFTGPLYKNGTGPGDVGQQYLADCYLPAAVASIARLQPDAIKKMITDHGDGTYTFKFAGGSVKVDADLYIDGEGNPIYGAGLPIPSAAGTKMELWFPLLEKAYAKYIGSYEDIGNGGSAADVMAEILDMSPVEVSVSSASAAWKRIKEAIDNDLPAAFGTASSEKRYEGTGIHEDHAYSVLDYRETNGKREVLMRNPWGYDEPGNDGKDDGVFWYSIEDCVKQFTTYYSVE